MVRVTLHICHFIESVEANAFFSQSTNNNAIDINQDIGIHFIKRLYFFYAYFPFYNQQYKFYITTEIVNISSQNRFWFVKIPKLWSTHCIKLEYLKPNSYFFFFANSLEFHKCKKKKKKNYSITVFLLNEIFICQLFGAVL